MVKIFMGSPDSSQLAIVAIIALLAIVSVVVICIAWFIGKTLYKYIMQKTNIKSWLAYIIVIIATPIILMVLYVAFVFSQGVGPGV